MADTENKSVSKSVAMPESLWPLIDSHAPSTSGRDRSGYIRNLVEADLRANGIIGNGAGKESEFVAKVAAAVEADPAVKSKIERMLRDGVRGKRTAMIGK